MVAVRISGWGMPNHDQRVALFWRNMMTLQGVLNIEPVTTVIAGHGDVLRHQPISETKIVPEFLLRQLRAIKAVGYSANTCPIPRFPMEAVPLLAACKLFLYSHFR